MSQKPKIVVYLIGFDQTLFPGFKAVLGTAEYESIENVEAFGVLAEREDFLGMLVPMVLCGPLISEIHTSEIAQVARMKFPQARVFFATKNRENYNKKEFLKNGYTDAFIFPLDRDVFKASLKEVASLLDPENVVMMKSVKLVDVGAGTDLDFDIRVKLPRNKKYVTYSRKGDSVDAERLNRLSQGPHSTIYIDSKDTQAFYKYSAKVLKSLSKSSAMGETEKQERIQSSVRNLFSNIFADPTAEGNISTGREMLGDCKRIVDEFILADDTPHWFSKFKSTMGNEGGTYSHAMRVSTYAALFSIGLGIGKPEELAIAGMFHDLGLSELPEELQDKPYESMTDKEKEIYHLHPEMSVKMLKMKKFIAPNSVYDMILQHHERVDGKGFPKGYLPPKLMAESQILSIADAFDDASLKVQESEAVDPQRILTELQASNAWAPELIDRVLELMSVSAKT